MKFSELQIEKIKLKDHGKAVRALYLLPSYGKKKYKTHR